MTVLFSYFKVILLIILTSILSWRCEKFNFIKANEYKVYTIAKGHHSSNTGFRAFTGTELNLIVFFDSSAVYVASDSKNQSAINKLYGFSDCSEFHHENSARFGWRWYENELQILAYCYKDSVRIEKFISAIPINKENYCGVKTSGSKYVFSLNGKLDSLDNGCSSTIDNGKYFLYPFFGGVETAPHDITIRIKEL